MIDKEIIRRMIEEAFVAGYNNKPEEFLQDIKKQYLDELNKNAKTDGKKTIKPSVIKCELPSR